MIFGNRQKIVAGCDAGTLTTKAVIMKNSTIIANAMVPTEAKPEKAAKAAMDKALSNAGLSFKKIKYCVGTGWGRKKIRFTQKVLSDIPCLCKGVQFLDPSIKTVINVGAQASNVVVINDRGKVADYAENDRCAAGTGKFLGIVAGALEVDINDIGPLSLKAKKMTPMSNQCVVFAESEMVNYVNNGEDIADIMAGINHSIARRLVTQVKRVGIRENVCMTGGVAKNACIVKYLSDMLETEIRLFSDDAQLISAIGAAVAAKEEIA